MALTYVDIECVRCPPYHNQTAQNLEQLRLVSSTHNENDKNDKRVLAIMISKNTSLDFCSENTFVKIRKTCARLSATANTF